METLVCDAANAVRGKGGPLDSKCSDIKLSAKAFGKFLSHSGKYRLRIVPHFSSGIVE